MHPGSEFYSEDDERSKTFTTFWGEKKGDRIEKMIKKLQEWMNELKVAKKHEMDTSGTSTQHGSTSETMKNDFIGAFQYQDRGDGSSYALKGTMFKTGPPIVMSTLTLTLILTPLTVRPSHKPYGNSNLPD